MRRLYLKIYLTIIASLLVVVVVAGAFWRFGADDIPTTRSERIAWLFDQWARVDAWIDATQEAARSLTPPRASHHPTPS